ncbi:MAG: potassium channel family protein [Tepidisphaeraceae bacterium]
MLTRSDLNYGLAAFGIQIPERFDLDAALHGLAQRPATSAATVVIAGAMLMHHFEKHHNPKMATLPDCLLYCATSLNVGYGDMHPVTPAGKLLATVIHTYGPALATRTLDGVGEGAGSFSIADMLRTLVSKLEVASKGD